MYNYIKDSIYVLSNGNGLIAKAKVNGKVALVKKGEPLEYARIYKSMESAAYAANRINQDNRYDLEVQWVSIPVRNIY